MGIHVSCSCGAEFNLKEMFAGQSVRCSVCDAVMVVPGGTQTYVAGTRGPGLNPQLDPVFGLHKYFVNQKILKISEQYVVADEAGSSLLFVERKANVIRRFFALAAAIPSGLAVGYLSVRAIAHLAPQSAWPLLGLLIGVAVLLAIAVALEPRRHINFFADATRQKQLLQVHQNEKLTLLRATYDVKRPDGTVVGFLIKPQIADFYRKTWRIERPDHSLWAVAHEDSLLLALLRRLIGPLFGLLRTNFVIYRPESENALGEFNRKMTLVDKYVLDMTPDQGFELDRRMALALAVMLDTGERR